MFKRKDVSIKLQDVDINSILSITVCGLEDLYFPSKD